ncbi:diadenylate cyclase CdaA [Oribacterium sp. WCC10]|uniref:diadenylate cyclase CdaA n=1 Tax=Oribacterium sp. WCC10 TaxID=1855343 RepID=UPI0008F0C178|nr:diadenylate cyclase [Oribacterium sp. WCC10]
MPELFSKMRSWFSLLPPFYQNNIMEIIILAVIVYEFLLWIKNTRAFELLKGLVVIGAFIIVAWFFKLTSIMWIIEKLSTAFIIAAVVIFQPEIRKALGQLGSRNFITSLFPNANVEDSSVNTINEIVKASFEMAKKKTGALIVIQQGQSLNDIAETGILINGIVSSALLINIFEKNTPLHDGAVVIVGDRVVSATCYLPLSETEISKDYGTRHRAALGISENYDAVTVVVSEETGRVSVAINGILKRAIDAESLRAMLPVAESNNDSDSATRFRFLRGSRKERVK